MRHRRALEAKVGNDKFLAEAAEEIEVMLELVREDPAGEEDLRALLAKVEPKLERIALETKMTGEYDANNAYLEVHPGAGGTESADWAQMLLRMYLKWCERHGLSSEVLDVQDAETNLVQAKGNLAQAKRDYIVALVTASRRPREVGLAEMSGLIAFGASPRATLAFSEASRAVAFLRGRGYVVPEDVKEIAKDVLRHRILLTYEAEAENVTADSLVDRILERVEVP
jgi:hypothetical protein